MYQSCWWLCAYRLVAWSPVVQSALALCIRVGRFQKSRPRFPSTIGRRHIWMCCCATGRTDIYPVRPFLLPLWCRPVPKKPSLLLAVRDAWIRFIYTCTNELRLTVKLNILHIGWKALVPQTNSSSSFFLYATLM